MLHVEHLYKRIKSQTILQDICFDVGSREVVGLLGVNGAGKSSLMKILLGLWSPTIMQDVDTRVVVCGVDVLQNPTKIAPYVGYLPEHNPLYEEMYVREYLTFMISLFKGKRENLFSCEQLIEMVGLGSESHKKIGQLSKGYRQRVGIAQALAGNPDVLILDEPTTGLDPNQLDEIHLLIKQLGAERTIIFSSHVLPEVKQVCGRVLVLDKGTLKANKQMHEVDDLNAFFREITH